MFINYRTKSVHKLYAILINLNTQHQNNDKYKVYTWISFFLRIRSFGSSTGAFSASVKTKFLTKTLCTEKNVENIVSVIYNLLRHFQRFWIPNFKEFQFGSGANRSEFQGLLWFRCWRWMTYKNSIGCLEDDKQEWIILKLP